MSSKRDLSYETYSTSMYQNQNAGRQLGSESGLNYTTNSKDQIGDFDPIKTSQDVSINNEEKEQEINPDKVENENLVKKNYQLTEENTRLKCNSEVEKFSMHIIYGAKIESLEKELQQAIFENHSLRQQMDKMRFTVCSLIKIIKKSCKRYLVEREFPPDHDAIDTDSDLDFNDHSLFPIEELQDQIHQMLCEYRDYISIFSEKRIKPSISKNLSTRQYEGFQIKSNNNRRKMSQDCRIGLGKNSIKKQSIYSGSFGHYQSGYNLLNEDIKTSEDQINDGRSSSQQKSEESVIMEIDRIRWVPNDAYNNCQICQTEFSLFFRKHHCRNCGILVCDECSPHKEFVSGYRDERVRVCKSCYSHSLAHPSDAVSYGK